LRKRPHRDYQLSITSSWKSKKNTGAHLNLTFSIRKTKFLELSSPKPCSGHSSLTPSLYLSCASGSQSRRTEACSRKRSLPAGSTGSS
jgi:hypothetical protein